MRYFIGLTFSPNFIQFKKIDSFRRRFDYKYYRNNILHMTLVPPFDVSHLSAKERVELWGAIEAEFEEQLQQIEAAGPMEFSGLDFHAKQKAVLFLWPKLPAAWEQCLKGIAKILAHYHVPFTKLKTGQLHLKPLEDIFLPLGRLDQLEHLDLALEQAYQEFDAPFELQPKHVFLFEKLSDKWPIERKLYTLPVKANVNSALEQDLSLIS